MRRAAIVFLLLLFTSTGAAAQQLDFKGLRPYTGMDSPRKFSFYIGVFPYGGFRDVTSFAKIPGFTSALSGFDIPSSSLRDLAELLSDVTELYNERFSIRNIVLPQVYLWWNSKHFEFSFRGGVVNVTKSDVFHLGTTIDPTRIVFRWGRAQYLITDQQKILSIKSRTLLGGEFWGTTKLPIKVSRYRLQLLFGIGGDFGYLHTHDYYIALAKEFSLDNVFDKETNKHGKWVGHLGLRLGFQLDGYKYLRPRVILEMVGALHSTKAMLNLGTSIRFWKILTLNTSILDITNPEVRTEVSRRFSTNSEVSIGGVFRSKFFETDLGYVSCSVGGKFVKFTSTILFEKKQVGLLIGVGLGYWP